MTEEKRFRKNDEGFVCAACGAVVQPLGFSSRDHCPQCLCSLHVDINPGDRANPCGGLLRPVSVMTDARKGYVIVSRCEKCGEVRRCRAAYDAKVQPDNLELLLRLTACPTATGTKEKNRRK